MSGPLVQTDRAIDTPAPSSAGAKPGWPFVRTLAAYDVVDSTNDRAAALVRAENAELPLAVWARRQTRGRGRDGHTWWSDSGSLTFTLAIDPAAHCVSLDDEPKLALATAVAVIDALFELGLESPSLGIRWPNDLEAAGRKLGGILPERLESPHGNRILIGVGLNVTTNLLDAPDAVRAMATSLSALHAGAFDRELPLRLLSSILRQFAIVLDRLVTGDPRPALRWDQLDLLRGRWVRVDQGARIVAGRGQGIDFSGALWLDDGRARFPVFGGRVLRPTSDDREAGEA
jgi:BirA family biotin operon repressor/biotin-[acetyl-CoA-carboxylase] ligase